MVLDVGDYLVEGINKPTTSLKIGDKIHSIINVGEGFLKARIGTKWVDFYYEDLKLHSLKETSIEEWLLIKVGNSQGYTKDFPFESCVE